MLECEDSFCRGKGWMSAEFVSPQLRENRKWTLQKCDLASSFFLQEYNLSCKTLPTVSPYLLPSTDLSWFVGFWIF
ncbi:hypothetical protein KOW79_001857 [Hemibagrus wyckioides]|uniref:Uncharacterized protein n=1 Tax=Hemibagrus wyckioides TaxID=337641 RepID=A0A9D3P622_9TELE|nr:hypothetical protein KOW79_001857 [Hemibagrus wyckioides]